MKKILPFLLIIAAFKASAQVKVDTVHRKSKNAIAGLSNNAPGLLVSLDSTYIQLTRTFQENLIAAR